MTTSLAILLVTHQSEALLPQTLADVAALVPDEIRVADNASTDASAALARRAGAQVISIGRNAGFAVAANIAARETRSDLLCFLNPDCRITPAARSAAERLLDPQSAACAVPDFLQHGRLLTGRQPGYTRWKILADLLENNRYPPRWVAALKRRPDYDDPRWHWPLGSCLFIPRRFFERIGGFPETYFLYMEDVELGLRIQAAGGAILPLGECLAHTGAAGSAVPAAFRQRWLNRARIQFARRHYGTVWALLLRLITLRGAGIA